MVFMFDLTHGLCYIFIIGLGTFMGMLITLLYLLEFVDFYDMIADNEYLPTLVAGGLISLGISHLFYIRLVYGSWHIFSPENQTEVEMERMDIIFEQLEKRRKQRALLGNINPTFRRPLGNPYKAVYHQYYESQGLDINDDEDEDTDDA